MDQKGTLNKIDPLDSEAEMENAILLYIEGYSVPQIVESSTSLNESSLYNRLKRDGLFVPHLHRRKRTSRPARSLALSPYFEAEAKAKQEAARQLVGCLRLRLKAEQERILAHKVEARQAVLDVRRSKFATLIERGLNYSQIAKELGMACNLVQLKCQKLGLKTKAMEAAIDLAESLPTLIVLHEEGYSLKALAEMQGVKSDKLRKEMRKAGASPRSYSQQLRFEQARSGTKLCRKCPPGTGPKPLSEFSCDGSRRGLHRWCKECVARRARELKELAAQKAGKALRPYRPFKYKW